MTEKPNLAATIPAVGRATAILEALIGQKDGKSVKDLSDELTLTPSMVSRILASLQQGGYVYQHPLTDRFHLTMKLLRMSYAQAESMDLDDVCLPDMRMLAEETGELIQLAAVDGARMTFILKVEGTNPLRVRSNLGHQVPLHASACGKCWLASLPADVALERLATSTLTRYTAATLTRLDALTQELDEVRRQGYALSREEWTPGVISVAAPIQTPKRGHESTVGAVVIAMPASQSDSEVIETLAQKARTTAQSIGNKWPPYLESYLYRKGLVPSTPASMRRAR